jgi:sorting nexin-4
MGTESQDLATDYEDLAASVEGLAFLESGITEPLNKFAASSLEWCRYQRSNSTRATNDTLQHLHALLTYSASHRNVLRLRDQKQVDFEALTDMLSQEVAERDRLASLSSPYGAGHGHGGVRGTGIGGYLRDRVDSLRGVDEERTRVERMARLDGRIAQLQDEVTTSHDISVAFSNEVQKEHTVFNYAKDQEMKVVLGTYVDGQIEMYQRGLELWEKLIPALERIRID